MCCNRIQPELKRGSGNKSSQSTHLYTLFNGILLFSAILTCVYSAKEAKSKAKSKSKSKAKSKTKAKSKIKSKSKSPKWSVFPAKRIFTVKDKQKAKKKISDGPHNVIEHSFILLPLCRAFLPFISPLTCPVQFHSAFSSTKVPTLHKPASLGVPVPERNQKKRSGIERFSERGCTRHGSDQMLSAEINGK